MMFACAAGILPTREPVACAARGKGPPGPLHPRPGAFAPWNPDSMHGYARRLAHMPAGNYARQLMISVAAQRRHAPMQQLCGKPPLQGVWGRAAPGTLWVMGSVTGTLWVLSPLASTRIQTVRHAEGCCTREMIW